MTAASEWMTTTQTGNGLEIRLSGDWTIDTADRIDSDIATLTAAPPGTAVIEAASIGRMDTAGAWMIEKLRRRLTIPDGGTDIRGLQPNHRVLVDRLHAITGAPAPEPVRYNALSVVAEHTGRATVEAVREGADLLNFLGLATVTAAKTAISPRRFRMTAFIYHLEQVGLNALPIVGLLSFLIGVVLAYQGADQLRQFGAEIFTVNLLGISILREMGILLTAIIVAGRSGSAFAAQIGTMQVNEEVDAMRTIGLDPMEVLVLPRTLALLVAMPLLAVYADLMGLAGGALMAIVSLDITFTQFTERLKDVVPIWAFWVGIIKAPVFGIVIALVGCREGLKVRGSADSVGRQTTRAVVVSIFLVIIIDALFSIFFSAVGV